MDDMQICEVLYGEVKALQVNQKVSGSNPTKCLAGVRDPTVLRGSQ